MCNVILSLTLVNTKAFSKATMASKDSKGTTEDQLAEEVGELHGVINPNEATILVHSLDEALILLEAQIMTGEEKDVMEDSHKI